MNTKNVDQDFESLTLDILDGDRKSLLLFFEARAVDHGGTVDTIHMNKDDMAIAEAWNSSGFIRFGRIMNKYHADVKASHWVRLSNKALALAQEERRNKLFRTWERRTWEMTEEKNS